MSGGCLEGAWEVSEPKFKVQKYYGSKNLGEEKIKLFTKPKLSLLLSGGTTQV